MAQQAVQTYVPASHTPEQKCGGFFKEFTVYTPSRNGFGRAGEKKKKSENPPTHWQKKKEKLERRVLGKWSGRQDLAGDSQSDQDAFPLKSGWKSKDLVF